MNWLQFQRFWKCLADMWGMSVLDAGWEAVNPSSFKWNAWETSVEFTDSEEFQLILVTSFLTKQLLCFLYSMKSSTISLLSGLRSAEAFGRYIERKWHRKWNIEFGTRNFENSQLECVSSDGFRLKRLKIEHFKSYRMVCNFMELN